MHSTLRRDDGVVADIEVSRRTDLARKDAAVSDARRSRKADLSAQNRVLAYFAGMANEHEVVDLCAAGNARFTDRRAIYASIGLNLDVVLDDHGRVLDRSE